MTKDEIREDMLRWYAESGAVRPTVEAHQHEALLDELVADGFLVKTGDVVCPDGHTVYGGIKPGEERLYLDSARFQCHDCYESGADETENEVHWRYAIAEDQRPKRDTSESLRDRIAALEAELAQAREALEMVKEARDQTDATYEDAYRTLIKDRPHRAFSLVAAALTTPASTWLAEREAAAERRGIERAAKAAEAYSEEIKHMRHTDGLGMGWLAGEDLLASTAERIRALVPGGGKP